MTDQARDLAARLRARATSEDISADRAREHRRWENQSTHAHCARVLREEADALSATPPPLPVTPVAETAVRLRGLLALLPEGITTEEKLRVVEEQNTAELRTHDPAACAGYQHPVAFDKHQEVPMTLDDDSDRWLAPEAAAARAGWSLSTLRRRVRSGRLAAHVRDGRTVFAARDVDAVLTVTAAPVSPRGERAA